MSTETAYEVAISKLGGGGQNLSKFFATQLSHLSPLSSESAAAALSNWGEAWELCGGARGMGLAAGTKVTSLFCGGVFDLFGSFVFLSSHPPRGDQVPSWPTMIG